MLATPTIGKSEFLSLCELLKITCLLCHADCAELRFVCKPLFIFVRKITSPHNLEKQRPKMDMHIPRACIQPSISIGSVRIESYRRFFFCAKSSIIYSTSLTYEKYDAKMLFVPF